MPPTEVRAAARPFEGMSAFPLTPVIDEGDADIDEAAFTQLIARLATAEVDSITVLGSTGSYAYLTGDERCRAVQLAVAMRQRVDALRSRIPADVTIGISGGNVAAQGARFGTALWAGSCRRHVKPSRTTPQPATHNEPTSCPSG